MIETAKRRVQKKAHQSVMVEVKTGIANHSDHNQ